MPSCQSYIECVSYWLTICAVNNSNLIVNDSVMMIITIAQYQHHRRCRSMSRYMTLLDIACITCTSTSAVTLFAVLTCFVVSGDVFMRNNVNFHVKMLELNAACDHHHLPADILA